MGSPQVPGRRLRVRLWTQSGCGQPGTRVVANHDAARMTSLAALPNPCLDDCLECWLQGRLDVGACHGTLDLVEDWARDRAVESAIDTDDLIDFLASRGGYCDCEVLLDVLLVGRLILDDLVLSCGS